MTGDDVVIDIVKQYDDGLITGSEVLGQLYDYLKAHLSKREGASRYLRSHPQERIRNVADDLNRLLD